MNLKLHCISGQVGPDIFKASWCHHLKGLRDCSTLEDGHLHSSATSGNTRPTPQCHIHKILNPQQQCCVSIKFHKAFLISQKSWKSIIKVLRKAGSCCISELSLPKVNCLVHCICKMSCRVTTPHFKPKKYSWFYYVSTGSFGPSINFRLYKLFHHTTLLKS